MTLHLAGLLDVACLHAYYKHCGLDTQKPMVASIYTNTMLLEDQTDLMQSAVVSSARA